MLNGEESSTTDRRIPRGIVGECEAGI